MLTRRSVRKFTFQVVPDETIEVLLRAAMHAPSARNRQPWHFYVITERDVLRKIPDVHPFAAMTQEASLAVVVCGDETILPDAKRWGIDCAAATQNLLLSAHALGLGAVWCGVYPDPERQREIKNLLKLPDRIHPFSLVPIGFPAEPLPIVDRFLPERIHTNAW
ncbi:MAG: nitroreductase family protein [Anaerolineaceae bacterium]|nr:nitroreductase family protein [Anaerolineaceae bacterium]